jgi:hypothetical protein
LDILWLFRASFFAVGDNASSLILHNPDHLPEVELLVEGESGEVTRRIQGDENAEVVIPFALLLMPSKGLPS